MCGGTGRALLTFYHRWPRDSASADESLESEKETLAIVLNKMGGRVRSTELCAREVYIYGRPDRRVRWDGLTERP